MLIKAVAFAAVFAAVFAVALVCALVFFFNALKKHPMPQLLSTAKNMDSVAFRRSSFGH